MIGPGLTYPEGLGHESTGYLFSRRSAISADNKSRRAVPMPGARIALMAALTGLALAGTDPDVLMTEAIRAVVTSLGVDFGVVFEARDGEDMVVVADGGYWAGAELVQDPGPGRSHHAEYTLVADGPVTIVDLRHETRFAVSKLIRRGVTSALSSKIIVNGSAFGVLAVYATRAVHLSAEDADFVQAVANVVGLGIERYRSDQLQDVAHDRDEGPAAGETVAGMTHDLNNVVAAVGLYTELLAREQNLDDAGRACVAAIREQVQRGSSLVWQVLDFANRGSVELDDVDLAAALDEIAVRLSRSLPERIRLSVRHDGFGYRVRVDRVRFQQIVWNLVANAKDAIDGCGQIAISIFRDQVVPGGGTPLDNPLHRAGVRVEIADTGVGMEPDVLSRAFDPFFTTKLPGEGIGLGLAHARGLIRQQDGHIAIASAPRKGTTVSIWLPAMSPASAAPAPKVSDVPRGVGERVLVVDDDSAVRSAIISVLIWLGYRTTEAHSGEEACSVLAGPDAAVDVVISDMRMPGMGGEGLAQEVAARWPGIPVILVSGNPSSREAAAGSVYDGGGAGTPPLRLQKPFSSLQLAVAMRTALGPR